jgi:hypothetical protein
MKADESTRRSFLSVVTAVGSRADSKRMGQEQ